MKEKSFGILNRTSISDEIEFYLEELKINGFTIIENVISGDDIKIAIEKLNEVYEKQVKEFSDKELERINESLLARLPLSYDDYFLKLATNSKVISLVKRVLGDYFVLHLQNGVINMPQMGHHQNSWHRDLPYQDFVISKPLALSVMVCLDDFNASTGGTIVLPFSHQVNTMPSEEYVQKHAFQTVAPKGSVIIFDSMIFHKAGYNSSNQVRRGINHMYTSAILKQQINIPASLKGKFSDDPFLKMLLGYEAKIADSVYEWRKSRLS